jgi:hypothetical protein
MTSYVITITEIDEEEFAREELEKQLSPITLQKNTIGIVTVSTEFLDSGMYAVIAEAVPFPLVGMTTHTQSANGEAGTFLFSILVLTSNDVEFAYGSSGIIPERESAAGITRECYIKTREKLSGPVKLALIYAPFKQFQCIHNYAKAISETDGRVPVFGSLAAAKITNLLTDTRTICEKGIFNDRVVMVLLAGDIVPEFHLGNITKESIIVPNFGEVTAAKDNVVTEINHVKVNTVLDGIGFNDGILNDDSAVSIAFLIEETDKDGRLFPPNAQSIDTLEDGYAIFSGFVPVGATLSLAVTTKDVILTTARNALKSIKEGRRGNTVMIYSCVGRQISLLDEPMLEYEVIKEEFSDGFTYIAASSGGEICPVLVTDEKAYNSEHSQSFIACVL